jgi:polysaccharide pyruvyl transferase WcaK-like protein
MNCIEIHGAGFQNKGAELMLRAAVHQLSGRLPEIDIAIDPSYGSYKQRALLGLYQLFPMRAHVGAPHFGKNWGLQKSFSTIASGNFPGKLIRNRLNRYGCVNLSQSQALVDIAGFAFSDEWGIRPTQDFSKLAQYYKLHKKPVILMPQAFGPFERAEIKTAIRIIVDNASLIFARDRQSFEYILAASPEANNVFRAPDITLFFPNIRNEIHSESDYVSVVPNVRMVDKNLLNWAEKYERYLILIIEEILRRNMRVKIIVHDISGKDISLTKSIVARIDSPELSVVESDDPLVLKNEIGNSRLLVGSRYHSLVAAFSQGVPSIGLGWSHKYEMLFEDFDCKELMITSDVSAEAMIERVVGLLDDDTHSLYQVKITQELGKMIKLNEDMWSRVIQVLEPCLE